MIEGKKILMLFPRFFYPPNDGGKIVFFDTVKHLSQTNIVDGVVNISSKDEAYIGEVQKFFRTFRFSKFDVHKQYLISFLQSLFLGKSYFYIKYFRKDFLEAIDMLLIENQYDIVWIESGYLWMYARYIKQKFPHIKVVLRSHNVESKLLEDTAKNTRNFVYKFFIFRESKYMSEFETQSLEYIDQLYTISPADADFFQQIPVKNTLKITHLFPGIDFEKYKKTPLNSQNILVFMGNTEYFPNYYGLKWFVNEIFPSIVEKIPDIKLLILCNVYPDFLKNCSNQNIEVDLGNKPDTFYYSQARLFICPLFSGGGIKIKIIQALACSKPVLTSDIGLQGLNLQNEENILVENRPDMWIKKIVEYVANDEKLLKIGEQGYIYARQNFDSKKNFGNINF